MRIGDRHLHWPPQHERESRESERDDGPGIRAAGSTRLAPRRPGRQRPDCKPGQGAGHESRPGRIELARGFVEHQVARPERQDRNACASRTPKPATSRTSE